MVGWILDWIKDNREALTLIIGAITVLAGGVYTVITRASDVRSRKAVSKTDQTADNRGNLPNATTEAERQALGAAVAAGREQRDRTYAALIDMVKNSRARSIEMALNRRSVREVGKIALRVSSEAGWGSVSRRIECVGADVLLDFIRPRMNRDSSAFSIYFLAERRPSRKLLLLPSEKMVLGDTLRALRGSGSGSEALDAMERARRLVDLVVEPDFEIRTSNRKELNDLLHSLGGARYEREADGRLKPFILAAATSIAGVIEVNRERAEQARNWLVYVTGSDTIPSIANGGDYRGYSHRLAGPHPTSHIYEAALRTFIEKHSLKVSRVEKLAGAGARVFGLTREFSNSFSGEIADLKAQLDVLFDELDPFHDDIAETISRERAEMTRRFRQWESEIREGRQILNDELLRAMAELQQDKILGW
jgi:hypothetical protein